MAENERFSVLGGIHVVFESFFHKLGQGTYHILLKVVEPGFDQASCLDEFFQRYFFSFIGIHCFNALVLYVQENDVVEAGFEVFLNDVKVLGVGEDINELFIREEVETGEV